MIAEKNKKWSRSFRAIVMKIFRSGNYKKKKSRQSRENWKNPEIRKKRIKNLIKKIRSKSYRENMRKIQKKVWTKKRRMNQSKITSRTMKNLKIRRLIARKLKERYKNHPYLKEKLSKEKQKYYENNPEARRNLLVYWQKPEQRIEAKGNIIVKSQGEKIINNTLFEAGIKPNYEERELNFPEIDPTPDFFPEGKYKKEKIKNVFIEFYGGHPKSWKSKVKKNKAYEKYKIPVLILTPYELKLENFKDYLLKELVKLSNTRKAKKFNLKKWQLKR